MPFYLGNVPTLVRTSRVRSDELAGLLPTPNPICNELAWCGAFAGQTAGRFRALLIGFSSSETWGQTQAWGLPDKRRFSLEIVRNRWTKTLHSSVRFSAKPAGSPRRSPIGAVQDPRQD